MMNGSRRRFIFGMVGATAVLVPAAMAFACVAVVSLTTERPTVEPGGVIKLTGREFAQGTKIEIHLDSPTGPLLTTVPPLPTTMTSSFTVDVTVPADVPKGEHFLVATQDYHNMNGGVPARSVIYVGVPAPPAPTPITRPLAVTTGSGPSAVSLVLIGLGVAAGGLLLVGLVYVMASRRPTPGQQPEAAKS